MYLLIVEDSFCIILFMHDDAHFGCVSEMFEQFESILKMFTTYKHSVSVFFLLLLYDVEYFRLFQIYIP